VIANSQQEVLHNLASDPTVGVELLYDRSFAKQFNRHLAIHAPTNAELAANAAGTATGAGAGAGSGAAAGAGAAGAGAAGGAAGGAGSGGASSSLSKGAASTEYIVLMLKEVEKRLEVLLTVVKLIPPALKKHAIDEVEKRKGQARRRAALLKNQQDEHKRKQYYAARAETEVFKRVRNARTRPAAQQHTTPLLLSVHVMC
jgi:hypothetical protein